MTWLSTTGLPGVSKPVLYFPSLSAYLSVGAAVVDAAGVAVLTYRHSSDARVLADGVDAGFAVVDLATGDPLLRCCFSPSCLASDGPGACGGVPDIFPWRCVARHACAHLLCLQQQVSRCVRGCAHVMACGAHACARVRVCSRACVFVCVCA